MGWILGINPFDIFRVLGLWRESPPQGAFLRNPRPYLSEIWRKPRKSPNDLVDKNGRQLKPEPTVYQLERRNNEFYLFIYLLIFYESNSAEIGIFHHKS